MGPSEPVPGDGCEQQAMMGREEYSIMNDAIAGLSLLRKPFPQHQISTMCKPTKKDAAKGKCDKCGGWHGLPAVQLSYVGHAALTDRLLDADPNWTWEPLALDPKGLPLIDGDGGMWIKLTVCGVTRLGYGDAQNRVGGDGVKEMIGDALRNAAMRFGAALELWHKGTLHVDDVPDVNEPTKIDPSLLTTGRAAAMEGTESLKKWWGKLSKDQKVELSDEMASLKDAAAKADAELESFREAFDRGEK